MKTHFKMQCAAIIFMATGYGWAGGHYIPADSNIFAYLFQFVVLGLLILLSIHFLSLPENETRSSHWSIRGLTIFSGLSLIINIGNIIHGAFNSNSMSFGSHNNFADLVPIAFLITGSGLWLVVIFMKNQQVG